MSLVARGLGKVIGEPPTRVLAGIDLEIPDGEFVALTGRSGSGKSTLLYLLSSLDTATEGSVHADGVDLAKMPQTELHRFRNQRVGFVFQSHYLISELTALENVLLPARKLGRERERSGRAHALLERFGIGDKTHRLPRQLSGGEQQRVAIARALIMEPAYLFADEPMGALDTVNGETVMRILLETNETMGTTVILVTHDAGYAARAGRRIHLRDGRVDLPTKAAD